MKGSGRRIYIIAGVMGSIFVVLSIVVILYMGEMSNRETKDYIRKATDQTAYVIDGYISENFHILSASAVYVSGHDFKTDTRYLYRAQEALKENLSFLAVGFIDLNGNCLWVGSDNEIHTNTIIGQYENIQKALGGENVLSKTVHDAYLEADVNIYYVPIIENGAVVGALFGADEEESLKNIVSNTVFAGRGFAHIIDQNGDYVVRSDHPDRLIGAKGIFDVEPKLKPEIQSEIEKNLLLGNKGDYEATSYKTKGLLAYSPLSFNNWYVFYVAQKSQTTAGIRTMIVGSIAIIVSAVLLFFLLIYLIYYINKSNRMALEKFAFEDPLTGERNLSKFLIDAREILKQFPNDTFSLLYGDIKSFQVVNDQFGRDTGDFIIRKLSAYISGGMREHELFAHLGGDNFVLLKKHVGEVDFERVFQKAERDITMLSEKYLQGKLEGRCGIYIFCPSKGNYTLLDMIDRANEARKRVRKTHGRMGYAIFTEEMQEQKRIEAEIESRMDSALRNREFKVFFQPKIDIQNNDRVMGFEALVRWRTPDKGMVSPGLFIPIFERNGFITKLDLYVFEEACRFYSEEMLSSFSRVPVMSVNVSRVSMLHSAFFERYTEIKNRYNIPDGLIELEFTESIAFEDHELFMNYVAALHANGFLCSLDDFGSGFSSLNVLMNLNIDVLKLDGSFFLGQDNLRRTIIIKNIISMTKDLNIKIVAEGVENTAHVNELREMGCDAVQGYIFARPMDVRSFMNYYRKTLGIHVYQGKHAL